MFTVPKVIRGLFERERRLLAILSRCAHRSVQTMRQVVDGPRAQFGTVASLQTFGGSAANFHPHVHALITEGAFLCPQCQVVMKPVSVIDDTTVVDRILSHLDRIGGNDPWDGTAQRGPPAA